jgi:hypothetical protein
MTSDASSSEAAQPKNNRTIMVPAGGLIVPYISAFTPTLAVAAFVGSRFFSAAPNALCALIILPFVILGLTVLHLSVRRIEIDDTYISTRSLLGTRRSLPLRDVASDMLLMGTEGRKYLEIKTAAGKKLDIPDTTFTQEELSEMQGDISERVWKATRRDIPTLPPKTDNTLLCFFVCLLPFAALIVIKLVQFIRWLI